MKKKGKRYLAKCEKANVSKHEIIEEVERLNQELKRGGEFVDKGFEKFRGDNKGSFDKIEEGLNQGN